MAFSPIIRVYPSSSFLLYSPFPSPATVLSAPVSSFSLYNTHTPLLKNDSCFEVQANVTSLDKAPAGRDPLFSFALERHCPQQYRLHRAESQWMACLHSWQGRRLLQESRVYGILSVPTKYCVKLGGWSMITFNQANILAAITSGGGR